MSNSNYYEILGVSKNASETEIKSAYRKKALKYHPDRNKDQSAKQQFQKLGEAFEILSDKNKRKQYDIQSAADGKRSFSSTFVNPDDAFGDFFSNTYFPTNGVHHNSENLFSRFFSTSTTYGSNIRDEDFSDLFRNHSHQPPSPPYTTRKKKWKSTADQPNEHNPYYSSSNNNYTASNNDKSTSNTSSPVQEKPPYVKQPLFVSLEDLYNGATKKLKVTRTLSNQITGKILTVNIKPGLKSGTLIAFPGEGDALLSGKLQDLLFEIEEKPNGTFTRKGDNLQTTVQLSLKEALTGFHKTLPRLDGQTMINLEAQNRVIQTGQEEILIGEGMPNEETGERGDLIVKFEVVFPESLTPEQIQGLKNIL
ncbi:hypothetical protein [Parasitella parasitica]|uniref:J domain-containing protein n=1 Tax=Parasitella parasitica TaxID=35722 RepID=A0A0B7MZ53_9FUNG|nr:hypothetical protein [Parasitella parasitica]